jgi:hypothetical protein
MDLRETTRSRGRHRQYLLTSLYNHLRGRHRHYLLAHLLRKNNKTIRVKRAPAITMMTSLPIHLSNRWPQALERNLSGRCNHQRKTKTTSKEKARAKEDR